MRLKIQGKDVEVRVQERRIVVADFIHKGKVVASGVATCAPIDPFSLEEGEKIAVTRAAQMMYKYQLNAEAQAKQKIEDVLKANGAISATIEFPQIAEVWEMIGELLGRLNKRRARKEDLE